jgi:hypothetical protein
MCVILYKTNRSAYLDVGEDIIAFLDISRGISGRDYPADCPRDFWRDFLYTTSQLRVTGKTEEHSTRI